MKNILNKLDSRQKSTDFQKSLRNAVYSVADYLFLPFLWLLTTPFFVGRLGIDQYGIWMLINTMLGLSGIASFGLSDATTKYVAKYRALDDDAAVRDVICTTLALYVILGLVTGFLMLLVAPSLVNHVFKIETNNTALAISVFRIGSVGIVVRLVDSVFQSAVNGYERYDISARIGIIVNTLTIGINVLLILAGYGLLPIMIASVSLVAISGASKAIVLKRNLVNSLVLRPKLRSPVFRDVLTYGFYSWLQTIGSQLLVQVDRLLIASMQGTSAMGYYVICLQLAQQIHTILSRGLAFVFPLVSSMHEKSDIKRLKAVYFQGSELTAVLAVALGLPLFIFSGNILSLWIGQTFANEAAPLLRILTFFFSVLATTIVPFYYLNGAGLVKLNTLFTSVSGVVVTICCLVFLPWFGVVGAAIARVVNLPISIVSLTVVHYVVLHDRKWYSGIQVIVPVLVCFFAGLVIVSYLGETSLSIAPLVVWIFVSAALSGFIAFAICRLMKDRKLKLISKTKLEA